MSPAALTGVADALGNHLTPCWLPSRVCDGGAYFPLLFYVGLLSWFALKEQEMARGCGVGHSFSPDSRPSSPRGPPGRHADLAFHSPLAWGTRDRQGPAWHSSSTAVRQAQGLSTGTASPSCKAGPEPPGCARGQRAGSRGGAQVAGAQVLLRSGFLARTGPAPCPGGPPAWRTPRPLLCLRPLLSEARGSGRSGPLARPGSDRPHCPAWRSVGSGEEHTRGRELPPGLSPAFCAAGRPSPRSCVSCCCLGCAQDRRAPRSGGNRHS